MGKTTYIDLLAMLGVEDAHPGGFALTKRVLSALPITPYTRVLEVGCGSGKTASYLYKAYHCSVTAIDMNERMLQRAKKRFSEEGLPISLYKASAEHLGFPPHSFDLVLSESVTAFTKIEKSLQEYAKVLREDGILIAIEITAERPLSWNEQLDIRELYGIEKVYTEQGWKEIFKDAGFQKVQILGGTPLKDVISASFTPVNSHQLPKELVETFYQHLNVIDFYKNILGYRVFLCKKHG